MIEPWWVHKQLNPCTHDWVRVEITKPKYNRYAYCKNCSIMSQVEYLTFNYNQEESLLYGYKINSYRYNLVKESFNRNK